MQTICDLYLLFSFVKNPTTLHKRKKNVVFVKTKKNACFKKSCVTVMNKM